MRGPLSDQYADTLYTQCQNYYAPTSTMQSWANDIAPFGRLEALNELCCIHLRNFSHTRPKNRNKPRPDVTSPRLKHDVITTLYNVGNSVAGIHVI